MDPNRLPTLEELQKRGSPYGPDGKLRVETVTATPEEQRQAKKDRAAKPKHLQTKKRSEALCRRQLEKFGATLAKARDDLITIHRGGVPQQVRVSKDVDFVGSIPLRVNGSVSAFPLRVESKGITLKRRGKRVTGSFPLGNLSDKERVYLFENRRAGGLSCVHMAWWLEGQIHDVHLVSWRDWLNIEIALKGIAEEDKRFSGKSLRYHADLDLLIGTGINKVSGRWVLEPEHWLARLLPTDGERPALL